MPKRQLHILPASRSWEKYPNALHTCGFGRQLSGPFPFPANSHNSQLDPNCP